VTPQQAPARLICWFTTPLYALIFAFARDFHDAALARRLGVRGRARARTAPASADGSLLPATL
jgi:hypothetical protein